MFQTVHYTVRIFQDFTLNNILAKITIRFFHNVWNCNPLFQNDIGWLHTSFVNSTLSTFFFSCLNFHHSTFRKFIYKYMKIGKQALCKWKVLWNRFTYMLFLFDSASLETILAQNGFTNRRHSNPQWSPNLIWFAMIRNFYQQLQVPTWVV